MEHVVFDLETLDTRPTAAILSIGAVNVFNPDQRFYRNIELASCLRAGLSVGADTIYWWFQQAETARDALLATRLDLRTVLEGFTDWCAMFPPDTQYWSHATFDPPILNHAFSALGMHQPIPYRWFRDLRSLESLHGTVDISFQGVPHNALHDALYEAEIVRRLLS